jgi:hypothetical protein
MKLEQRIDWGSFIKSFYLCFGIKYKFMALCFYHINSSCSEGFKILSIWPGPNFGWFWLNLLRNQENKIWFTSFECFFKMKVWILFHDDQTICCWIRHYQLHRPESGVYLPGREKHLLFGLTHLRIKMLIPTMILLKCGLEMCSAGDFLRYGI